MNNKIPSIILHFFPNKNKKGNLINRKLIKYTDESLYSSTFWYDSQFISNKINNILNKKNIIITDATAHIGGNTINFAFNFSKVNAVEINPLVCSALKKNIDLYSLKNVNVYCDDYNNIKDKLKQDVIFFDPPWGGPSYKEKKTLNLYLGKNNLTKVISELLNKTKLIVIKLPYNFNLKYFLQYIKQKGFTGKYFIENLKKFYIIFLIL